MGRSERLKSHRLIEQLFKEGKTFAVFPFRVYYLYPDASFTIRHSPSTLQFGVSTSSKNFKKAIERNRIKRLIREAYRLQKKMLHDLAAEKKQKLALFVIYTGKEPPEYKLVYEKMGVILQKLINIVSEKNPAGT